MLDCDSEEGKVALSSSSSAENESDIAMDDVDVRTSKCPKIPPLALTILQVGSVVVAFVGIMVGIGFFIKSPYFQKFIEWTKGIGFWAYVMFGSLIALAGMPMMVGYFVFVVLSGFLLGWWALLLAPIADTVGYTVCFFSVRYFFRSWFLKKVAESKHLTAVIYCLNQHPIKFTILLRLTPVTLGIQNALLAVSHIRFWKFIVFSQVGHLPLVVLYVTVGQLTVKNITEVLQGKQQLGTSSIVALVVQILGTVLFLVGMGYFGRKTMREMEQMQGGKIIELDKVSTSGSDDSTGSTEFHFERRPLQDSSSQSRSRSRSRSRSKSRGKSRSRSRSVSVSRSLSLSSRSSSPSEQNNATRIN